MDSTADTYPRWARSMFAAAGTTNLRTRLEIGAGELKCAPNSKRQTPKAFTTNIAFTLLLGTQVFLLAFSATRHSPTSLEPAFLVSGVSHWQFGRFELYRVNPPLVRLVAALPCFLLGYTEDWTRFHDSPGSRAEFPLGEDFVKANGRTSLSLITAARWACIPISILGSLTAYYWAKSLYASVLAGLFAMALYIFEPNLLAHAELITPDAGATAFGLFAGYTYYRWMKHPTWNRALLAGIGLGLAQLTKFTWLPLFIIWPALWILSCFQQQSRHARSSYPTDNAPLLRRGYACEISTAASTQTHSTLYSCKTRTSSCQLCLILLSAVYLINAAYAFDGTGTRLRDFSFISKILTAHNKSGVQGNRFRDSLVGWIPLPLPKQYILGADSQKSDLEFYTQDSFLHGEWKQGGWWYYYLYGLIIKIPFGVSALFIALLLYRLYFTRTLLFEEVLLLSPALVAILLVSAHTTFNIHLRYVYPALGFLLVFCGQLPKLLCFHSSRRLSIMPLTIIAYLLTTTLCIYPHQLSYFNELVGHTTEGRKHLLGSSAAWGQDWLYYDDWLRQQPSSVPVIVLTNGMYNPAHLGLDCFKHCTLRSSSSRASDSLEPSEVTNCRCVVELTVLSDELVSIDTHRFNGLQSLLDRSERIGASLFLAPGTAHDCVIPDSHESSAHTTRTTQPRGEPRRQDICILDHLL